MGYVDMSSQNGGLHETPVLDHLTTESVSFSQKYAASGVCSPFRAALLNGPYPHRTGSIDTLEWRDLAGAHPERVGAMARALETWFEEVEAEQHTIANAWERR